MIDESEAIAKESRNFLKGRVCFHCSSTQQITRTLIQNKFALLCFEHWKKFMPAKITQHIETYEQYQVYDDFMFYMMTVQANPQIKNLGTIRN